MQIVHYTKFLLMILLPIFLLPGATSGDTPPANNSPLNQKIVGTWKEVTGFETMHFSENQTVTITFGQKACFSLSGKYSLINTREIEIALEGTARFFIDRLIMKISMKDNFLYVTDIDAKSRNENIDIKIRKKKPSTKYRKISDQP